MKREYVIPDFLAAITADALLRGPPALRADELAVPPRERGPGLLRRLYRGFKRVVQRSEHARRPLTVQLTFDEEWAGGWYALSRRLLTAATTRPASVGLAGDLGNSSHPDRVTA